MKKLFATDLDGTLVVGSDISSENLAAVKKLKEKGNIFAVSTGRPFNGVENLKDNHNIEIDYYILLNGALILDGKKNIIMQKHIKYNVVCDILKNIQKDGMGISVESGFKTYLLTDSDNLPYPNLFRVNSILDVKEDISLISIYMETYNIEQIEDIKDYINGTYGDEVVAYRNTVYIDVVPVGCSKGSGVAAVSKIKSVDDDDIYTIGDSWNDITMFKPYKNSFTFNHVEEDLKYQAKNLVDSVAECIESYILV